MLSKKQMYSNYPSMCCHSCKPKILSGKLWNWNKEKKEKEATWKMMRNKNSLPKLLTELGKAYSEENHWGIESISLYLSLAPCLYLSHLYSLFCTHCFFSMSYAFILKPFFPQPLISYHNITLPTHPSASDLSTQHTFFFLALSSDFNRSM